MMSRWCAARALLLLLWDVRFTSRQRPLVDGNPYRCEDSWGFRLVYVSHRKTERKWQNVGGKKETISFEKGFYARLRCFLTRREEMETFTLLCADDIVLVS